MAIQNPGQTRAPEDAAGQGPSQQQQATLGNNNTDDNNNTNTRQQGISSSAGTQDQGPSTNDIITKATELVRQLREGEAAAGQTATNQQTQPQQSNAIQELQQQLDIIIQNQQAQLLSDQRSSNQSEHTSSHRSGTTSSSASLRKPKLQRPEPFDGSSEELHYWIVEFEEWPANADVTAAQKIFKLQQRYNQPLQDFINNFKTIIADLDWNDAALSDAFSRKLTPRIAREIHQGYFAHPPASYAEWKRAAQQAELHIQEGRRRTESSPHGQRGRGWTGRQHDTRSQSPQREPQESSQRGRGQDRRRPFQPSRSNKKYALPDEEWKRRRNEGLCLRCGEKGHWEKQCLKAFQPSEASSTPKN
ncbi:hypothetical protein DTO195F2_5452 [Paecilomyces variotii]|nr:hypothetical protein DTO195F2_5452 [Paecilomyces variotii]